jgi:class 3 adenylate cyclase/tetratricopeptide (TPR) repeat protein
VATELLCPSCGTANEAGRKFCGECGSSLATACPACGTPNPAGVKFCGECGASLSAASSARSLPAHAPPAAERRLVSVLFADLVGFTAASEGRDAEETRELLTTYFDASRRVIELYGGAVEKFIGDAVMAVWGTPTATEDDAERAVRAALELVAAVPELDPALQARAGVLTGEVAVTIGAEGQGMVAGDVVNTASRIQSIAEAGTVLVGQATRRASEAAIAYEDAGTHALKGKAESEQLWRATRVVAAVGGEGRGVGLEAPFVGRDAELRLVKDLFHTTSDEGRARLVSVIGVAGVGKSRLSWELEKYMDGLAQTVWWHRGRCLAYGDGVAYWALAEMIRARIGVLEGEPSSTIATRLRETLAEHFTDGEEREWVEQRLLPLVGLGERAPASDREDLFPAWRRLFERLAEQRPLVLVFEDLHWADAGLIAFIDHLLDWARSFPIFVLTLARPEIADRHSGFPGATRSATTLPLDPLAPDAMDELLRGLVPGLPDDLRERIRERADGIPLYAVETVRMLLDRALLEPAGSEYRVTKPIESLEVPETLHALIASRLDGLPDDERRVLQHAAVLGKTFTRRGLVALSGATDEELEPLVMALLRKELLYLETDPRSPERGQLGFLQALVQRVAYETLSRRERRSRHLAAAEFLTRDAGIDPSEIAEVIAAHFLDAFETDERASDADEVKASARTWFVRAGERAAALAAPAEAQRSFERAGALADDDIERARLLRRAGEFAWMASDIESARRHLGDAIAVFREAGLAHEDAEASSKLAGIDFFQGRIEDAVARMEAALAVFVEGGDEAAEATVLTQLGRFYNFEGNREVAFQYIERALDLGERLRLPAVVSQAMNTKAVLLERRPHESIALMRGALELAREHDLADATNRGYINLSYVLWVTGAPNSESEPVIREGLAHARRRGDREGEAAFVAQLAGGLYEQARWDELDELEVPEDQATGVRFQLPACQGLVAHQRGDSAGAVRLMEKWAALQPSADRVLESCRVWAQALIALAEGRFDDVLALARPRIEHPFNTGDVETNLDLLGELTLGAESASTIRDLIGHAEAANVPKPPSTVALIARLRAKASGLLGHEDPTWETAIALLRENELHLGLAKTLVEYGEWLTSRGRADEAAGPLAEARAILEPLRATRWLDRIESAAAEREGVPA